jgi:hypothetical protein
MMSLKVKLLKFLGDSIMTLNGLSIDISSLEYAPIDYRNENVHLEAGYYSNGRALTDSELNELEDTFSAELHALYMNKIY